MRRLPLGELAVAAAFFLAAFAATSILKVTAASDLVWPGNALAAALLVRMPRVRWLPVLVGAVMAGVLATELSLHLPLQYSVSMSCVNVLEIGTTAWIFRNWLTFPLPNISFHQGLRMAGVFAFAVPFFTALPGGWLIHSEFGKPWYEASLHWWLSGAIGACLCAPAVYLYSTRTALRLISRPFLVENIILAVFCFVSTYLSIRYMRFPFIAMAVPLTVAAFRAGAFGAAVLSGACGSMVIALWTFGIRPEVLNGVGPALPFLALAATILPPVAVGLATDKRRTANRELAAERQRLRTTLRAIADAVITTDADAKIIYINTAAHELLGQSLEAVEGRNLYDVVAMTDPRTSRIAPHALAKCLETGEVIRPTDVVLLHRPDGGVRYVSKAATPVFGPNDKVVGAVLVLRDATETYERDRKLSHLATHDVLTGAYNRFEFERRLQVLFDRARFLILPATLIVVDLDRFKAVNDVGGHAAGDAVLRRVTEVLRENIRAKDSVARLGGDEFAVVLEKVTPDRARAVAHQIQQALNPLEVEWNGQTYSVGASLGVATITNGYESTAAWAAGADAACYEAKRTQRGQVCFAPPLNSDAAPGDEPEADQTPGQAAG
ncbi:MAG: diguanylate cyclase [Proteobacteria bacterium]|nr:diguanylate cyclase [Pseudomonadota bacterium]